MKPARMYSVISVKKGTNMRCTRKPHTNQTGIAISDTKS